MVKSLRQFHRKHGLGEIPLHYLGGKFGRGSTEYHNGHFDPRAAQLLRLGQTGDGKAVGTKLLQLARNGHRAVAVGIGLDHAQKLAVGRAGAQGAVIMFQIAQVDLSPGSRLFQFHLLSTPWKNR